MLATGVQQSLRFVISGDVAHPPRSRYLQADTLTLAWCLPVVCPDGDLPQAFPLPEDVACGLLSLPFHQQAHCLLSSEHALFLLLLQQKDGSNAN